MRALLTLTREILARLLRHLGWGALLVPVAAMGIALYGVNPWTVAVVAAALLLAAWRPAAAAGLLPAALTGAGIYGLVTAATAGHTYWVSRVGAMWGTSKVGFSATIKLPPGVSSAPLSAAEIWRLAREQGIQVPHGFAATPIALWPEAISRVHDSGLWWGHLLIPMSLLLLAVGLWLLPRTLGMLRVHAAGVTPYLLLRMQENYWGLLLVPATAFGLSVFGVHTWSVMLTAAALVIAAAWPAIAADLTPAVLAGFAVCGFMITADWQSLPAGTHKPAVLYGMVLVGSRSMALLVGAEASALLALGAWLVPRTIGAHARALAAPEPAAELAGRVRRLTETREHAIDSANAELLRIERDLHDGAQARLVALGMNLRAVERLLPAEPEAALALVGEARGASLRALNELRDLIRGIYPPVLADRGLAHAVRALVLDTPLQTELDIDLPGRLAPPVESACYFAVAEALTNAVRHSGAQQVHVRVQHTADVLRIEVADDGIGGADPAGGTGLRGVERRLGTFDGILAVSSPVGGPTMIAMEIPCTLSPPKTHSR